MYIKEIHEYCLPEDRLNLIENYQNNGNDICMIGDGINDAPALKKVNVGIAMSDVGSDIAVDAANIALAITGILNPIVGALVHNAGSVVVIINSALLLKWNKL